MLRRRLTAMVAAVGATAALSVLPVSAASTTTTTVATAPRWTEDRLLSQLIMVAANITAPTVALSDVRNGIGGVVFLGQPPASARNQIVSGLRNLTASAMVPLFLATDEEGGGVQRLANVAGSLPWPREMAAWWGPATITAKVRSVASAMASLGITMDLGPVADTAAASNSIDVENLRSFSENGSVASRDVRAFLTGLSAGHLLSVVKHFPGLGHANGNTNTQVASDPPLAALQNPDLLPFRNAIAAGVPAIMMSNVVVPDWGGAPASINPAAYAYLRFLGFSGVIVTDSLGAGAITGHGASQAGAAVSAICAGADMAMLNNASLYAPTLAGLRSAVAHGTLSMSRVVSSVNRLLVAKNRYRSPREQLALVPLTSERSQMGRSPMIEARSMIRRSGQ